MRTNIAGEELYTLDELKSYLAQSPNMAMQVFKIRLHIIVDIYNKYLKALSNNITMEKRIKELEFKVASLELETAGNRFVIIA